MSADRIHIRDLRLRTRLGVPDVERATEQTVSVSLVIEPREGFDLLGDDIERTIDYHAVARRVAVVAAERERRLAETLAVDIAETLLGELPIAAIEVTVDKAVLPQAAAVGVRVRRPR